MSNIRAVLCFAPPSPPGIALQPNLSCAGGQGKSSGKGGKQGGATVAKRSGGGGPGNFARMQNKGKGRGGRGVQRDPYMTVKQNKFKMHNRYASIACTLYIRFCASSVGRLSEVEVEAPTLSRQSCANSKSCSTKNEHSRSSALAAQDALASLHKVFAYTHVHITHHTYVARAPFRNLGIPVVHCGSIWAPN